MISFIVVYFFKKFVFYLDFFYLTTYSHLVEMDVKSYCLVEKTLIPNPELALILGNFNN